MMTRVTTAVPEAIRVPLRNLRRCFVCDLPILRQINRLPWRYAAISSQARIGEWG